MIARVVTIILFVSLWCVSIKAYAGQLEQRSVLLNHLFAAPALKKENLKSELKEINQAELEKEQIEHQYNEVLGKRDELFNLVSMLKERGLDYIEAEEVLEEVQKQLNFLRPDNYSGTEIPDAEKYDDKSISDLEEAQHATVVEEVEEEKE